ncbi:MULTISPECIES: molybdate ABC transporter substrate-binding protein [Marinomonas]|uniref:Molybdate ABC transporter substrate-binding protein n=1 Tax=Marinomonas arctica TaxID=383750 RepID=A0A7H1J3Z1_9GAMM|nr:MULTISPECIES: molybdate ABC transporter substrate-binding protein [Marinomonas]MCS7486921.1 molybdate ABC transporter substrate-binding protein [Marinomonas sp. BSi20414]QNT05207.1 molybdate ABC transporter substrate-binding protein [Marinomonas arctica]GGN15271.1 molybdate-binding periplasmic protein ModA [Marinomonas arctica]
MRFLRLFSALLFSGLLVISPSLYAEVVYVAVASNFTDAMKDIAKQYEAESGNKVALTFGSSGKFVAQIQHGAPFQVFLSADQNKPDALEKAELVVPNSRFTYAIGALALWSAKADFIHNNEDRLKNGDFNKVALANPKLAPYGVAAMEVLEGLGLTTATQPKWVMGENISQTYQFVSTVNADLGFVALSQIMSQGQIKSGSSWIIPADQYSPIRQDAVLLKSAASSAAARDLLDYLRSDKARRIIHSYGYKME